MKDAASEPPALSGEGEQKPEASAQLVRELEAAYESIYAEWRATRSGSAEETTMGEKLKELRERIYTERKNLPW